jgi:hypothetical protein
VKFDRLLKFPKLNVVLFSAFVGLFFVHPSVFESEEMIPARQVSQVITRTAGIHQDKVVIKAVEPITLHSASGHKIVQARIDTGATQSSIDIGLAREMGFTKYIGKVNVVSANGIKTRPLVEVDYELSGKKIKSTFTLADRSNLNYSVLIGRTDLNGFLIDPSDN